MITIQQHSEFVQNVIAANPIPAANRFVAIHDGSNRPAVLSHSQDDKLELIAQVDGNPKLIDFGQLYGITGPVQAFTARQTSDGSVCVAVSTKNSAMQSSLSVIYGIPASKLAVAGVGQVARNNSAVEQIFDIFMADFTTKVGENPLPLLFVAFQPRDMIANESQLAMIEYSVDPAGRPALSFNASWSLATNPTRILDTTFIQTDELGPAAVVLYESAVGLKLQLRTFDLEIADFAVEIQCPSNASSLSSFCAAGDSRSKVLVGGDQITVFDYSQYTVAGSAGTVLTSGSSLAIKDLHTILHGSHLCLWYTDIDDSAFYYAANTNALSNGTLAQLLPAGKGGRLSGSLSTVSAINGTVMNSLVSVDEKGDLTLLQQASDTGMWEKQLIYTASGTANMYIPSFTIRIQATTDAGSKALSENPNRCQLHLSSTGATSVIVNGSQSILTEEGSWFDCDVTGTLTYIISTADMSCHQIQVNQFRAAGDFSPISVSSPALDPSSKINQDPKIQALDSADSIKGATTQGKSPRPLISSDIAAGPDLQKAAQFLPRLSSTKPPQNEHTPWTKRFKDTYQSAQLPALHDKQTVIGTFEVGGGAGSLWDHFHFLYEVAEEVADYMIHEVDGIVQLVINWGEKAFRFVLDTAAAIGKAISWVFKKLKVLVQDLIDFIGFLFEWPDIVATAKSIASILDCAMQYGSNQITVAEEKADAWISKLQNVVKQDKRPPNQPAGSNATLPGQSDKATDLQHSVPANFASYHLQHGGFSTQSSTSRKLLESSGMNGTSSLSGMQAKSSMDPVTDMKKVWDDIRDEVKTVETLVESLYEDVKDFFTPTTNTDQVFDRVKAEFETALLSTLQNLLNFVLDGSKLLVDIAYQALTTTISIPIFTALWKKYTDMDFNILNAVSLVVAIPATVFYKAVTAAAPPSLDGRINLVTITQFFDRDANLDPQLKSDIIEIMEVTALSTMGLGIIIESLMMAVDEAGIPVLAFQDHLHANSPTFVTSPLVGNVTDTFFFILMTGGLIVSFPTWYDDDRDLRTFTWIADTVDLVTLGMSRAVGAKFEIPRVQTKKVRGFVEFFTAILRLATRALVDADELAATSAEKKWKHDNSILETTADSLDLVGTWAFTIAALTDGEKDEVSLAVFPFAFYSMCGLLGVKYALLFAAWVNKEVNK